MLAGTPFYGQNTMKPDHPEHRSIPRARLAHVALVILPESAK
jgi:hypothetical protein